MDKDCNFDEESSGASLGKNSGGRGKHTSAEAEYPWPSPVLLLPQLMLLL
jgi:hypothetical protein